MAARHSTAPLPTVDRGPRPPGERVPIDLYTVVRRSTGQVVAQYLTPSEAFSFADAAGRRQHGVVVQQITAVSEPQPVRAQRRKGVSA